MSRFYIAGPMTGIPEMNFPAFHAVADQLRAMGHIVINPAEINPDKSMAWDECMRTDIAALVTCDAVHLLPGWENSKGATLELHIAERLGLKVTGKADKHSHYRKDVSHLNVLDVYRVLDLYQVTHPAIQHAIKKLLAAGGRGAKNDEQDVREAIDSLNRWLEMRAEDAQ